MSAILSCTRVLPLQKHNISGDEDGIRTHACKAHWIKKYKNTNIDHYLDQLEQYFVANEVQADSSTSHRRRAILISVIGGKAHNVLADLCSPPSPSSKSYAELKAILKKQFAPKRLAVSKRYHFDTFVQAENTSVSEFAA